MTVRARPNSQHSRFETLDGMRGIAALMVMVHHFPQPHPSRLFLHSAFAVDLFFMLSGFVLMHSYAQRLLDGLPVRTYALKRVVRLYPLFLLGIVLGSMVLVMRAWNSTLSGGDLTAATVANLFCLPCFNDVSRHAIDLVLVNTPKVFPCNPPAWSLFFELVGSVAFLGLIRLKRPGLFAATAVSFAVFATLAFANEWQQYHKFGFDFNLGWDSGTMNFLGGFPRALYDFSAGMVIYSLLREEGLAPVRASIRRWVPSPYALYLALLLTVLCTLEFRGSFPMLSLAVIAPALLFCGSVVTCDRPADLAVAKFLGSISYPVYCLHFPIQRAVYFLFEHFQLPHVIAMVTAIALTLGVAVVSLRVYDLPVRSYLIRRFNLSRPRNETDRPVATGNLAVD